MTALEREPESVDAHAADLRAMQARIDELQRSVESLRYERDLYRDAIATVRADLAMLREATKGLAMKAVTGGLCLSCAGVVVSDTQPVKDILFAGAEDA